MKPISFALVHVLPAAVITGYFLGGWFNFLTPFVGFIIIPLVDHALGTYTKNPPESEVDALQERDASRAITISCVPITVGLVIWGAWVVSLGTLKWYEFVGFTMSMGDVTGAVGINVSHELQHRVNRKVEPFLSRVLLSVVLYMHWAIEHVVGHHRNVATPEDPATARKGESFYRFWFRTVGGGFTSSWRIEKERVRRKHGKTQLVRNRVFQYVLVEIGICIGIYIAFGWPSLLYFLLQAFFAISLLEAVNYVEHYGLLRKKIAVGKYEKVRPVHSWNNSNKLSNMLLFNLERHSDHHYKPGRRYQVLRHFDESPQLPTGYFGMTVIAMVPPLWKKMMHPRLNHA